MIPHTRAGISVHQNAAEKSQSHYKHVCFHNLQKKLHNNNLYVVMSTITIIDRATGQRSWTENQTSALKVKIIGVGLGIVCQVIPHDNFFLRNLFLSAYGKIY